MKMIYSSIILSVALTFFFPEKLKDIFLIIKKNLKNHYITLQTCTRSFSVQLFIEISRKFCLKSVA